MSAEGAAVLVAYLVLVAIGGFLAWRERRGGGGSTKR